MNKSVFSVPKMDCPSEERMVRLAVDGEPNLQGLSFDLANRQLTVLHVGAIDAIAAKLMALGLGAQLLRTDSADDSAVPPVHSQTPEAEARTLCILLGINGAMFVVELGVGIAAQSTGLIADSLDMFADAAVYGLGLYAVGKSLAHKVRVAHLSGWIEAMLALGVLFEVARRFWWGSEPTSQLMISMGLIALIANVACLYLISAHRQGGAHMKASWIFSTNDVIANLGVIFAGVLVAWTGSPYPDLVIGALIGLLVLNGARRILALRQ
jgi:Co/Zn/Cd efflux system component